MIAFYGCCSSQSTQTPEKYWSNVWKKTKGHPPKLCESIWYSLPSLSICYLPSSLLTGGQNPQQKNIETFTAYSNNKFPPTHLSHMKIWLKQDTVNCAKLWWIPSGLVTLTSWNGSPFFVFVFVFVCVSFSLLTCAKGLSTSKTFLKYIIGSNLKVSDLNWRFYGGRINSDKTWRQPTTDRWRAICLWKVGRQSFAIPKQNTETVWVLWGS